MNSSENRKILFIINPISGSRHRTDIKNEISTQCGRHLLYPVFMETKGQNDEETIRQQIKEHSPDIVVAVGGDGTVNLLASLLINRNIKLGIIPTGSANGMAFELNIPAKIEQALSIIAKGVSKPIDLLMINGKHLAVHLSDLGMNARIIKRFDKEKIRGIYGYARQFFKELKSPSHFHCIVQCKGKRQRKYKAVMVVMLNTHFYGTGAIINPMGKINDGLFEIVVIKPYPWHYLFRMVIAFFSGNIHRLRHVRIVSCKHAKIMLQKPQDLQVDGEPTGEVKNIEIEVLPGAIEVIYNDQQEHFFLQSAEQSKTKKGYSFFKSFNKKQNSDKLNSKG